MVEYGGGREEGVVGAEVVGEEEHVELLEVDAGAAVVADKGDEPGEVPEDNELFEKKWVILIYSSGIDI